MEDDVARGIDQSLIDRIKSDMSFDPGTPVESVRAMVEAVVEWRR